MDRNTTLVPSTDTFTPAPNFAYHAGTPADVPGVTVVVVVVVAATGVVGDAHARATMMAEVMKVS
ncbi:MAG: hypothetical protein AMXMBFR57_02540 [Acidimicrobiia bacterium]